MIKQNLIVVALFSFSLGLAGVGYAADPPTAPVADAPKCQHAKDGAKDAAKLGDCPCKKDGAKACDCPCMKDGAKDGAKDSAKDSAKPGAKGKCPHSKK